MIRIVVSPLPGLAGDAHLELRARIKEAVSACHEHGECQNRIEPQDVLFECYKDAVISDRSKLAFTIEFFDPNQFSHHRAKTLAPAIKSVLNDFAQKYISAETQVFGRVLPSSDSQYCV